MRGKKETIEIRESDSDIFLQFLRFLYCDEATYGDENNAIQMLYLADKYNAPSLTTNCVDFLKGAMQSLNAFDIIKLYGRQVGELLFRSWQQKE